MSLVYRANEKDLADRAVALKVLTPELANDPEFRERFVREVAHAASLRHPNVIPIYAGPRSPDGTLLYVAMPLIHGTDLGAVLAERGRLELPEAVRIVRQVADALEHAHEHDLVHRDVKPGNILIERANGHVYLCDFGIAKRLSAEPLTQTGRFIGTPGYVAPEGINCLPVDRRADVYALGAVFYQCVSGRQPYDQSAQLAKLQAQLEQDPPPLTAYRPDLPAGLDQVVAKALSRRPQDRYPACASFVDDVVRVLRGAAPVAGSAGSAGSEQSGADTDVGSPIPAAGQGRDAPARTPEFAPDAAPPFASPTNGSGRTFRVPILVAAALAMVAAVVGVIALTGDRDGAQSATDPSAAQLARIPEPLRSKCRVDDTDTLLCTDQGRTVRFDLFDDRTTMDSAYNKAIRRSDVDRASGDCTIATGAEHRYPGVGQQVGRVLCYSRGGTTALVWTDDTASTVATVEARESDDIELERSWWEWMRLPAFPAPEEQRLLDLVERGSADCRRPPASTLDEFRDVVAGIECEAEDHENGARQISYFSFSSRSGLLRSYDTDVTRARAPNDVYCANADQPAPGFLGNHRYDLRSVELGGLLCHPTANDEYVVEWSVEPLNVLGRAVGANAVELADWWDSYYGPPTDRIVRALNEQSDPAFPNDEESELIGHIPVDSRTNCIRPPKEQIELNVEDARPVTAAVVCGPTPGASIVFYYRFESQDALDASAARYGEDNGEGCRDAPPPPDFYGYSRYSRGSTTGVLMCGTNDGKYPFLSWTDDTYDVQAFAFQTEDVDTLLAWWRTSAGPL